jgi:hypothetical protein
MPVGMSILICFSEKVIICFYQFHEYAKFVMCIVNVFLNYFSKYWKLFDLHLKMNLLNFMLGLYGGEDLDVIFNTVIFISKWEIWKIRNKVKYNQSRIGDQTIFNTWKNNLKKQIKIKSPLKLTYFIFICFYISL